MADNLADELERNIPLSEMIQTLRDELTVALRAGEGANILFDVEQVDLELQVKVGKSTQADGKLNIWVVGVGGAAGKTGESVHTFKLRLKPHAKDKAGPVQVSDTEKTIPG